MVEMALGSVSPLPHFFWQNAVKFRGKDHFLPGAKPIQHEQTWHVYQKCTNYPSSHHKSRYRNAGHSSDAGKKIDQGRQNPKDDRDSGYCPFSVHSFFVDLPYRCLGRLKWNVRRKAPWLGSAADRIRSDLKREAVFAFEIEYGKNREF